VKSLGGAHSALRAEILIGFIVTDLISAAAFEDAKVKMLTPHKMVVRTDFMKPPKYGNQIMSAHCSYRPMEEDPYRRRECF
jgi:hypothetical protein